jgi:hemerythrin
VLCPFINSSLKITQVDEVHKLLGELLNSAMLKMSHLEVEKTKLSRKLIGMRFNVEYL